MDVEKEISGLEVTILGATYELHDDLLVRTIRMKEEDGKVMELKIEGKLESLGPTKFSVEFSFGRRCSQVKTRNLIAVIACARNDCMV